MQPFRFPAAAWGKSGSFSPCDCQHRPRSQQARIRKTVAVSVIALPLSLPAFANTEGSFGWHLAGRHRPAFTMICYSAQFARFELHAHWTLPSSSLPASASIPNVTLQASWRLPPTSCEMESLCQLQAAATLNYCSPRAGLHRPAGKGDLAALRLPTLAGDMTHLAVLNFRWHGPAYKSEQLGPSWSTARACMHDGFFAGICPHTS